MKRIVFYLFASFLAVACSRYPSDVEWALMKMHDSLTATP